MVLCAEKWRNFIIVYWLNIDRTFWWLSNYFVIVYIVYIFLNASLSNYDYTNNFVSYASIICEQEDHISPLKKWFIMITILTHMVYSCVSQFLFVIHLPSCLGGRDASDSRGQDNLVKFWGTEEFSLATSADLELNLYYHSSYYLGYLNSSWFDSPILE